jgi:tetratricopeptide (TPR) repeat protein
MIPDWSMTSQTAERHLSRGKYAQAIEQYRTLVNWDPSDLTALNTLGDLYVRAGLDEQARGIFSRVAQGYRDQGFTSKAAATFKKILRIAPDDLESAVCLAECYLSQGRREESIRLYADVAEAHTRAGREWRALDMYKRMAEIDLSNTSLQLTLGDRFIREGLTHRAFACFTAAGAEFSRQGDLKQAYLAYLKAHSAQPDDQKTLRAIVEVCAQRGEAENAIAILRKCVSTNPGDVELHRILGTAYLSDGRLNDAETTFQKLLALDGSQYRYLLMVAERFIEAGDLDRAVEQIDGFVDALIDARKEQEAVALLQKALDRDPEHPRSLRRMALIFRRLCEDLKLAPTLRALADSALLRGERDEAIEALTELCSLEPNEQTHRTELEKLGVQPPTTPLAVWSTPGPRTNQDTVLPYSTSAVAGDELDNLELSLALKQIYAVESLSNPAAKKFSEQRRKRQGGWSLASGAHEFVAADDIRGRISQHSLSRPVSNGTPRNFQFFTPGNRRGTTRIPVRVPLVVISDAGGWREFTETVDVSDRGLRFKLVHPVPTTTKLRVLIEPAKRPEYLAMVPASNFATGIVRNCISRQGRPNLVGVELDLAPESPAGEHFANDKSQITNGNDK